MGVSARGNAVVVQHDLVADGKLAALHDAGRLQRLGVGPHGVVVEAAHDEGDVGNHAVEHLPGNGLTEGLMRNARRQQHGFARPLLAEQGNGLRHGLEARHAVQHQGLEFHGAAEQVHMALDDAGHHRLLRRIYHPRVPGLQPCHVVQRADADDAVPGNRHGLGPGAGRVHRQHAGVGDQNVGGCHGRRSFRMSSENARLTKPRQAPTLHGSINSERR